jgi:DNA-binding transcriptional LysR family regulator
MSLFRIVDKSRNEESPLSTNIGQIVIFNAICEAGTVSGAARKLNLSQPAVSKALARLEAEVGRLFERTSRRMIPTQAALLLLQDVERLSRTRENAMRKVDSLQRGIALPLRIATTPSLAHSIVAHALRRFFTLFPDAHATVVSDELPLSMLGSEVDVAVTFAKPAVPVEATFIELGKCWLVAVYPDGMELPATRAISLKTLVDHGLIGYFRGLSPIGDAIEAALVRSGVAYAPRIETSYCITACQLVASGCGVAIVDEFTIRENVMPAISWAPIRPEISVQIHAVKPSNRPVSHVTNRFIECLGAEMNSGNRWRHVG